MLGYSAMFQGRHERAERFFEEAADVVIPRNTVSLSKPIEARVAFSRGSPATAFEILRSHVDEILTSDNLAVGNLACTEFVAMMVALERRPDAARVLGFLETGSSFGVLSVKTFVADAAATITADSRYDRDRALGEALGRRQALAFVRDVLDRLLGEPST